MAKRPSSQNFTNVLINALNVHQSTRAINEMEKQPRSIVYISHEDMSAEMARAIEAHNGGPIIVRHKPEVVIYDTGFGREETPKIEISVEDVISSTMSKKMAANAAIGAKQIYRRPYDYDPGEFKRLTDAIHKASTETSEWEAIMHKTFGSNKPRRSKIVLYYRDRLSKLSK